MCNTCNPCGNGCGCGNNGNNGCGCDVLLNTLKNLFAPVGGCGCGNNGNNGTLLLVNNLGPITGTPSNGCGCGNNNGYDAYYVRQYALNGCGCNN